jgi:hypothetical protein
MSSGSEDGGSGGSGGRVSSLLGTLKSGIDRGGSVA